MGSGTAGTFTGIARFLRERLPNVYTVVVETEGSVLGGGKPGPHKVEGIGSSFIPKNFDSSVCSEIMMVTDEQAFGMVKELAAREGVLGGSSAGANVYAAVKIARESGRGSGSVTLIPDSAERYLLKKIFEGGRRGGEWIAVSFPLKLRLGSGKGTSSSCAARSAAASRIHLQKERKGTLSLDVIRGRPRASLLEVKIFPKCSVA